MKQVTYNGQDYDAVIDGNDIILQGLHNDLILTDAGYALKQKAIDEVGMWEEQEDGASWVYSKYDVNDYFVDNITEFVYYWIEHKTNEIYIINHNNN